MKKTFAPFVLMTALSLPLGAGTIFTDFGPGYSFQTNSGWTEGGSTSGVGYYVQAMGFVASATSAVTQIDVALGYYSGTNSVSLSLNSNNSGVPGAALLSWNLTNLPSWSGGAGIETVTTGSNTILTAGATYWLVALPGASDTYFVWDQNSASVSGAMAQQFSSGGSWGVWPGSHTLGAFDVLSGTTGVPEPTTVLLALAGLALFKSLRRA